MFSWLLVCPLEVNAFLQRVELLNGLEALRDLLCEDRFFVLHYMYDDRAAMIPCLYKKRSGLAVERDECQKLLPEDIDTEKSLESSDIQLGLLIRCVHRLGQVIHETSC